MQAHAAQPQAVGQRLPGLQPLRQPLGRAGGEAGREAAVLDQHDDARPRPPARRRGIHQRPQPAAVDLRLGRGRQIEQRQQQRGRACHRSLQRGLVLAAVGAHRRDLQRQRLAQLPAQQVGQRSDPGRLGRLRIGQQHRPRGLAALLAEQFAEIGLGQRQRKAPRQPAGLQRRQQRQQRARQHHRQDQRDRPQMDPRRGGVDAAGRGQHRRTFGEAQRRQRRGIRQAQAGQPRRRLEQQRQRLVHRAGVQESAGPADAVVEHQPAQIERGDHAQRHPDRTQMQQQRGACAGQRGAQAQPLDGQRVEQAGQAGRIGGVRRRAPFIAAGASQAAQVERAPGQPAAQAARLRRGRGPQRQQPAQQHQHDRPEIPQHQRPDRRRQQADAVRGPERVGHQPEHQTQTERGRHPAPMPQRMRQPVAHMRFARPEAAQRRRGTARQEALGRVVGGRLLERDARGPAAVILAPQRMRGAGGLEGAQQQHLAGVRLVHGGRL